MSLQHLSTSTPASSVSASDFDRNDLGNSAELDTPNFDDILRNSPAANLLGLKNQESLPESSEDVPTPGESEEEEEVPEETSDNTENDSGEESEQNPTEEEASEGDDKSTPDAELPTEEDIDWEYKVPVTVDGKTEYVTLEEIRKGYATDRHLSQKGRELGELKKQIEQERTEKLSELVKLGTVFHEDMTSAESQLGQKYHELSAKIEKARDDGDTYTARELKEERESIQEKYWEVRNKREEKIAAIAEKIQAKQAEEQQILLETYNKEIKDLVPDYSDDVAKRVREFALEEGIPDTLLSQVFDARVVKFIDDFRRLKQARKVGEAKRKESPVVRKSVPTKKGTPESVKAKNQEVTNRNKVLSGQASQGEQLDFLKRISSVSKKL
jgi:hypothetical protein